MGSAKKNVTSRRTVLKSGLAAAGLGLLGLPEWTMPALAQGETVVPFTDIPANFATNPSEVVRVLDIRKIDGRVHAEGSVLHDAALRASRRSIPAAFRLKVTGLVDRPKSLSLDELKADGHDELVAGFECSGNGRGGCRASRATAGGPAFRCARCSRRPALKADGARGRLLRRRSRRGRSRVPPAEDQARPARSAAASRANRRSRPTRLVAYALNGEPLTKHQGSPLRLRRARAGTASPT